MILSPQTALAGGRYIVQRHLDSGAMADVYLATDTQRAVNVALKVLRSELSLDEYFEEYFRREATVLQQLQHPNIVRLYELVRDSNLLFLVMDYIEGPTLQQHLFEKKLLQTAHVLKIGQALAAALDYAHKKGVIHRDIKPSNVLLANSGVILLNDFGVARVTGNTTSAGASGPVGTLAYMAPEQISGADITGAADQYALAVVIWELLSGRRPFTGKASRLTASPLPERIIDEHLHHQPPADVLPPALTSALTRALAKDPRQRFPTCAAFMQVLQTAATKEMPSVALARPPKPRIARSPHKKTQPAAQNPSATQINQTARAEPDPDISKKPKPAANVQSPALLTALQIGLMLLVLFMLLVVVVVAAPHQFQPYILRTVGASLSAVTGLVALTGFLLLLGRHWIPAVLAFLLFFAIGPLKSRVNRQIEPNQAIQTAVAVLATQAAAPTGTAAPTDVAAGTIAFDGGQYIGELSNGLPNGQGTWTTINDYKYIGTWKQGKRNGQGTKTQADGISYTGEWKDNKLNGQGTYTWPNGDKYTGEWQDSKLNGQGTYTFANGAKYTGRWADGKLVPTVTALPTATALPTTTALPTATALPAATKTPAATQAPAATAPPTAAPVVVPTAAATVSPPTAAAPVAEAPAPTATPITAAVTTSGETASQGNARNSAQRYLRVLAFSRGSLINQLKYEGFSEEDAAYAVDSLNTNWNEQALKKVASYLRSSAFSRSRLIGQLMYEQFSQEQAEFAVNGTAVDWNEQAAKKAASYLKYKPFSRDELIAQLKYEDFTQEQAEYGVSKVGL